jgi:hypothetical protein
MPRWTWMMAPADGAHTRTQITATPTGSTRLKASFINPSPFSM